MAFFKVWLAAICNLARSLKWNVRLRVGLKKLVNAGDYMLTRQYYIRHKRLGKERLRYTGDPPQLKLQYLQVARYAKTPGLSTIGFAQCVIGLVSELQSFA